MFKSVQEAFAWIQKHSSQGVRPGLHRMESALERLGHPERRCKFIHVAGTNGKGSTSAMIASVLQAAGYKTGLFISPFIQNWNERVQVDGKPISEQQFLHWANHLKPVIEQMIADGEEPPSEFEFWTLLAICYFALDECPWFIVWETGLGGRLDSTNVVYPLVSVLTEIGLDHKEYLGNTISEIAYEKAGIIKSGVPVVCGSLQKEAVEVFRKVAGEKNSRIYVNQVDFQAKAVEQSANGQTINFSNIYRTLENLPLSLVGSHQVQNAATALMALEVLRQQYATVIEDLHFQKGLEMVRWPGRLEKVLEHPTILLDGAHNRLGIDALVKAISSFYTYDQLYVLLAAMKEKEEDMFHPLIALADHVIVTQVSGYSRSKTTEELQAQIKRVVPNKPISAFDNVALALDFAKQNASEKDLILVTGSLYLVAEARGYLLGNN